MTDGMKSGAGSDPFAENGDDESTAEQKTADREPGETPELASDRDSRTTSSPEEVQDTNTETEDDLPYIYRRNGVKDKRRMIQYFLREETEQIETDAQRAVEDELGTDVYLTDIREALVRVGAKHTDEVADELRDWGYRLQEE